MIVTHIMTKTSLQAGDVYALQEKETGKWFAFQVVQIGEKLGEEYAVYVDLDYWSDKKPGERDLKKMSYLTLNHHFWDNEIRHYWVPISFFPSNAIRIGEKAIKPLEECRAYGDWPDGSQQKWTERWNKLPQDQVSAFKKALTETSETIIVAGKEVKKNLYRLYDDTLSALSDFSELDKLPGLGSINTSEDYPQLFPFLERRYLIRELRWDNCRRKEVDLSRTHLEELEISGEEIESIILPPSMGKVTLKGKLSPNLKIHSPNDGYYMVLRVELQDDFLPDVGLYRLTNLRLSNIQEFSLKRVSSRFPCLMWLGLAGKPGYISDVAEIAKLHDLETLTIDDLFGFSAEDFPRPDDLPNLKNLWLESIPAEAGKIIKRRYKNNVQDLSIIKLRSDEWLHENMNNPLRHWDGSEFVPKSKYTKSVALWKETRRRVLEEVKRPEVDFSTLKSIANDYVEGFNQLDRRSQFIETEEREDIMNAFEQILDESGISQGRDDLMQIIEEKRNW